MALVLVGGTLASLNQAELTETRAMLDRTEAGAVAAEQAMLRVFDAIDSLQRLAQTRRALLEGGDTAGAQAIEQHLRGVVLASDLGIQKVTIHDQDGAITWSHSPMAVAPGPTDSPQLEAPGDSVAADAPPYRNWIKIAPPVRDPGTGQWNLSVTRPLRSSDGQQSGTLEVSLDPIAVSRHLASLETRGSGVTIVQRRGDGGFLALSHDAQTGLAQRPATNDPVALAVGNRANGQLRDIAPGVDRLIGYRAPAEAPIVVSQILDTKLALGDFFQLRRVMLTVIFALIAAALTGTRVILANYLLRQRLGEQAMRDPLTQLFNRRYFTDVMAGRMAQAQREGKSAAVLLIDLDGFKQVNDTRGHPVGDALLRQVADRLLNCAAPGDVVMRLGGDEFALVRLGRQQRRDATSLARFVVAEMSRVFEVDGYHLRVSGSVGVALSQDGGDVLGDLLRNADVALYFVKSGGGGAYQVFDPAMEESVRTRRALEVDLREALARNELEVYFQPLVQLEPRRVCGFEALLRWHHPELGMVSPSRFIPIAEETGLIAEIGGWVLTQACAEAARWAGNVRIAVNLSPVQFDRSDIVDVVASALRQTKLDPSRLELEITEGIVMRENGDVLQTMRRLQGLGVRLALDDFGTGYASLSYLRAFPFDKVKIDGSFMADLEGDGGTIVRAMLGLCRHLSLDTLVEGVETQEQLDWLRREGCTEVQGYLFSRALPASGVAEVIARVAERGLAELSPILADN